MFAGIATYFALVTLADLISRYVLRLKPSRNVDPGKLMLFQHVTPEQFDAYFDTRRWIRCISLGVAFDLFPAFCSKIFCSAYVLSTLVGIAYVRFCKIPRPKLFQGDDSLLALPHHGPRAGCISPEEWALNKATGFPVQVPVDF